MDSARAAAMRQQCKAIRHDDLERFTVPGRRDRSELEGIPEDVTGCQKSGLTAEVGQEQSLARFCAVARSRMLFDSPRNRKRPNQAANTPNPTAGQGTATAASADYA